MRENGLIKSKRCYEIFRKTDPEWFLDPNSDLNPWDASEISTMNSEELEEAELLKADTWLHSALVVVAILTLVDETKPKRGPVRLLDLGCGSGYMTAILAQAIYPGTVVSADTDAEKVSAARSVLSRRFEELMPNIELKCGDAFEKQGERESFDIIHVGGAVDEIPKVWVEQLKVGGSVIAAFPDLQNRGEDGPKVGYMLRRVIKSSAENLLPIDMMVVNYEKLSTPDFS
ncbi:protein-L-isoaspartate O-methyltransferase-like [Schistocerca gregaria]|uniref:protein-L-isoaspartate O-methyltransferase-like n=1 Tax=Schistocerca gregaria TaxID=7010 RepID=UPI00211E4BD2|nr:protein-L-isoaspartate O-methyltransferase-like [Schistocerca gregaria]